MSFFPLARKQVPRRQGLCVSCSGPRTVGHSRCSVSICWMDEWVHLESRRNQALILREIQSTLLFVQFWCGNFFRVNLRVYFIFIILFWLHWVFVVSCGLLLLWNTVPRSRRLSSCSKQAYLPLYMWDLSSLMRDGIYIPCIGSWILNHWATREVTYFIYFYSIF